MFEHIQDEFDKAYPKKVFLTLSEVAELLACEPKVVYNWTRRPQAERRPPALMVGKEIRFPKNAFLKWLCEEQLLGGKP